MDRQERIVSLRALVRRVLEKWRAMLVFAFVVALAAAAVQGVKLWPRLYVNNPGAKEAELATGEAYAGLAENTAETAVADEDPSASANGSGEEAMEGEVADKTMEEILEEVNEQIDGILSVESNYKLMNELQRVENQLAAQHSYLDNSFVARFNPMAVAKSVCTISVTTPEMLEGAPYSIQANGPSGGNAEVVTLGRDQLNAVRILNYYLRTMQYGMDWGTLTEEYSTDPRYFNELVSVVNTYQDYAMADIRVVFGDEEGAEKLMGRMIEYLSSCHDDAEAAYGEHEVSFSNRVVSTNSLDKNYYTWTSDRLDEINKLTTQRDNLIKKIRTVAKQVVQVEEELYIGRSVMLKQCILYAAAGFIAGLILFAILCAIWLVLTGKVLSGRELNRQYGLKKLAAVPGNAGGKKLFDKAAAAIDSSYYSNSDSKVSWRIADENIRKAIGGQGRIALVTDLNAGLVDQVRKSLENAAAEAGRTGITYTALAALNDDPAALKTLDGCDAAVLVARTMTSKYSSLGDLFGTVHAYGKEMIGSVVVD